MEILTICTQNRYLSSLITRARDRHTPPAEFRSLLRRLGLLFGFEIANLIDNIDLEVTTPMLAHYRGLQQAESVLLVSSFEDADFFAAGIADVFTRVHLGRIDAPRKYMGGKWHAPIQHADLPDDIPPKCAAVVAKTILASGCTATALLGEVLRVTKPTHVIVAAIISHQHACQEVATEYPCIPIEFVIGEIDPLLDDRGFVVPGLGSVTERLGLKLSFCPRSIAVTLEHVNKTVSILYINHRNEVAVRRILPINISFGSAQWHQDEQWLLTAYDLDRQQERTFAMKNIRAWWVGESTSA